MSEIKPVPALKQVRIYQPTYQLNPRKRFNAEKVNKILHKVVDAELEEVEYNDKVVPEICLNLAETIRTVIKEENYDRCRILVAVTIGQRRQQSVHIFHSFLWDNERDMFASYNFENCHIFANVIVYVKFLSMANDSAGVKCASIEACENRLSQFFANREEGFYERSIMELPSKWQQVIDQIGADSTQMGPFYVE